MMSAKARGAILELAVILAAALALWFAPSAVDDYGLQTGFRALIYLALAEGWNLMAGSAGLGASPKVGK